MAVTTLKSVPFWPDQVVEKFPHTIALLGNATNQYFRPTLTHSQEQTGNQRQVVSETSIRNVLRNATRGLIYMLRGLSSDKPKFVLLVGDLKLVFTAGTNREGNKRLFPQRVYYADSTDRARAMQQGIILQFEGVQFCSGTEFRSLEANPQIKNGLYVDELASLFKITFQERAGILRTKSQKVAREERQLSDAERDRLDTLNAFIESEYDIDCRAEQNEPRFSYVEWKASSVRHIKRVFYDFTLEAKDYERLVEKQIKLIATDDIQTESDSGLAFEVVDYEPVANQPVIRLSSAGQVQSALIPKTGTFKLMALPVLKNIRGAILKALALGETKNPWLLSLLSGEYDHPSFQHHSLVTESGAFPPTPSQQRAIEGGIATPDYALVLGPPGTGKTTVILEWVKHYAALGKRVLITSQNNKAVDNVLERLISEPNFECLRIGNESKVSASLADCLLDNKLRELQKRMFTTDPNLSDYLDRAQVFLESVQQQALKIIQTFKSIEQQSIQLDQFISQRKKLNDEHNQRSREIAGKRKDLDELLEQFSGIERKQTRGLFKLIKRGFNLITMRRLQSRITALEAMINRLEIEQKQSQDSQQQLVKEIDDTKAAITSMRQILNVIDANHPGNYAGVIEIPSLYELSSSNINALQKSIEHVKNVLRRWFEKVSTEREQSLYPLLLEHVNVVGATCIGINTKELFRNIDFDVVIVDEAGQIQAHNLMVPLSRCEKAILVGDHKQIRPIVQDEVLTELKFSQTDDELELYYQSWFELLWNTAPENRRFMLDTQFRCPSEISDFVSAAFYDGKYYAGKNKLNSAPLLKFFPTPFVWLDTAKMNNNSEQFKNGQFAGNRSESNIVVEVFKRALEARPELLGNREIAIIVPYKAHIAQIKKRIKALQQAGELPSLEIPMSELVASVDSFQGQERELIIFACSRSNERGNVGFMKAWQRMNVAVTRAKRQLVIIGNTETMTKLTKEDAPDAEFKRAMQFLVAQLQQSKSILPGFWFLPKAKNKSQDPSNQRGLNA